MPNCVGSPTFNEIYPNAFSEWPSHIPGLICKTPPFGAGSSQLFAKCCSGTVYNITSPTSPNDPAYPMSCATFCQVDPALTENNERYPYGFDDHFMCLTDGLEEQAGEVVCATNPVEGVPMPTSYLSTPTGEWMTRSYSFPARPSEFLGTTSSDNQEQLSSSTRSLENVASTKTSAVSSFTTVPPAVTTTTSISIPSSANRSVRRTAQSIAIAMLLAGLSYI